MRLMSENPPVYGAPQTQAPVCPRHPERPSYIRCQRCERPACVECQRPAAVGVQCVDCVTQAQRDARAMQPRTAVGASPTRGAPLVTFALMAVAGAIYLLQAIGLDWTLLQWGAFQPARALAMPWTFLSAGFLHGSLLHVGLNLYCLWIVGQFLERTLGHWRYLAVFLLSVFGGHVAVALFATSLESWTGVTVGASGGVFGLFGALFVVQRRMGGQAMQVLVLVGINMVISFLYPNISWQGHLGGLVTGAGLALLLFTFRPKARPGVDRAALARTAAWWHAGIIALSAIALLGLVLVRYALALSSQLPVLYP